MQAGAQGPGVEVAPPGPHSQQPRFTLGSVTSKMAALPASTDAWGDDQLSFNELLANETPFPWTASSQGELQHIYRLAPPLPRTAISVVDAMTTPHFAQGSESRTRNQRHVYSGWMHKKQRSWPHMWQARWVTVSLGGFSAGSLLPTSTVSVAKSGMEAPSEESRKLTVYRSPLHGFVTPRRGAKRSEAAVKCTLGNNNAQKVVFTITGRTSLYPTRPGQTLVSSESLATIPGTTPPALATALATLAWPPNVDGSIFPDHLTYDPSSPSFLLGYTQYYTTAHTTAFIAHSLLVNLGAGVFPEDELRRLLAKPGGYNMLPIREAAGEAAEILKHGLAELTVQEGERPGDFSGDATNRGFPPRTVVVPAGVGRGCRFHVPLPREGLQNPLLTAFGSSSDAGGDEEEEEEGGDSAIPEDVGRLMEQAEDLNLITHAQVLTMRRRVIDRRVNADLYRNMLGPMCRRQAEETEEGGGGTAGVLTATEVGLDDEGSSSSRSNGSGGGGGGVAGAWRSVWSLFESPSSSEETTVVVEATPLPAATSSISEWAAGNGGSGSSSSSSSRSGGGVLPTARDSARITASIRNLADRPSASATVAIEASSSTSSSEVNGRGAVVVSFWTCGSCTFGDNPEAEPRCTLCDTIRPGPGGGSGDGGSAAGQGSSSEGHEHQQQQMQLPPPPPSSTAKAASLFPALPFFQQQQQQVKDPSAAAAAAVSAEEEQLTTPRAFVRKIEPDGTLEWTAVDDPSLPPPPASASAASAAAAAAADSPPPSSSPSPSVAGVVAVAGAGAGGGGEGLALCTEGTETMKLKDVNDSNNGDGGAADVGDNVVFWDSTAPLGQVTHASVCLSWNCQPEGVREGKVFMRRGATADGSTQQQQQQQQPASPWEALGRVAPHQRQRVAVAVPPSVLTAWKKGSARRPIEFGYCVGASPSSRLLLAGCTLKVTGTRFVEEALTENNGEGGSGGGGGGGGGGNGGATYREIKVGMLRPDLVGPKHTFVMNPPKKIKIRHVLRPTSRIIEANAQIVVKKAFPAHQRTSGIVVVPVRIPRLLGDASTDELQKAFDERLPVSSNSNGSSNNSSSRGSRLATRPRGAQPPPCPGASGYCRNGMKWSNGAGWYQSYTCAICNGRTESGPRFRWFCVQCFKDICPNCQAPPHNSQQLESASSSSSSSTSTVSAAHAVVPDNKGLNNNSWRRQRLESRLNTLRMPWEKGHKELKVTRSNFLASALGALPEKVSDWRLIWRFAFIGEPARDAGGVAREFWTLLSEQLFHPHAGLFMYSASDQLCYQINPAAASLHGAETAARMFRVTGRLLAKALLDRHLLTVSLNRPLLKHLLALPVAFDDLQQVDAGLHRNLKWMLECEEGEVEALCQTFTAAEDHLGMVREVALVSGGESIDVTDKNKVAFVQARFKHAMMDRVAASLGELLKGFYEVVPISVLQGNTHKKKGQPSGVAGPGRGQAAESECPDAEELEVMLCGVPEIDIEDWKRHTTYKGVTSANIRMCLFWRVVEEVMDDDQRTRLLQFVTGTSRLPAGGFANLQGVDGSNRKFELCGVSGNHSTLPKSHTCFNRLDLPNYTTFEHMKLVLTSIVACDDSGGFTID